ncbi:hypothetical protein PPL_08989 [Heterostelium album PN500]|uniref:DUF4460 domain-containing protein n=1 Tax=Heterostelium pallidum (strain ATCC 26659 / Pp 5 / PN500) TaxID=670386 RepID=D3BKA8_HETP5|nr:hypothetical protein PPL_08989 [Heterostelium album PN500]EFA78338.1 hypothetical protein PPL_08989 [Heterostelium album PN500]|eukprot:XP_020430463.1 hypothetical protein PPL_08989 [Heterostelium album PN500]
MLRYKSLTNTNFYLLQSISKINNNNNYSCFKNNNSVTFCINSNSNSNNNSNSSCNIVQYHNYSSKHHHSNNSHQHHHSHNSHNSNEHNSHSKPIPNARSVLKKFFLKVHPDLFYQYPKLKNINDKSLRVLQSFLEEVKSEKVSSRSYKLEFYYLDARSATTTNEDDIPYVEISFDIDNSTPRKLNTMIKKAEQKIQNLLKITGITDEFYLNSLLGKTVKQQHPDQVFEAADSLLSFLTHYSNDARERCRSVIDEERSIDIIRDRDRQERSRRSKLETFHFSDEQIDQHNNENIDEDYDGDDDGDEYQYVNKFNPFGESNNNSSEKQQKQQQYMGFGQRLKRGGQEMKQQLFEPFGLFKDKDSWRGWDKIKAGFVTPETSEKTDDSHISLRLEGMTLFFTNKSGVDLEGRLQLDIENPQNWQEELNLLKPSIVIRNIRSCRDRKNLEIEAADSIGVGCIYTDYNEQNTKEYIDYLKFIIETSAVSEGYIKSKLNDINLRVVTPNSTKIEPFTLDERNGVINIPLHGNVEEIFQSLALPLESTTAQPFASTLSNIYIVTGSKKLFLRKLDENIYLLFGQTGYYFSAAFIKASDRNNHFFDTLKINI